MAVLFLTSLWVNLHVTDFSFFLPTYRGPLCRLCRSQGLPLDKVNNLPISSSTHSSPFDWRDRYIWGGSIPDVVLVMLLKWEMVDTCCLKPWLCIPYMDNYSTAFDGIWWQANLNVTQALMPITATAIRLLDYLSVSRRLGQAGMQSISSPILVSHWKTGKEFFFLFLWWKKHYWGTSFD